MKARCEKLFLWICLIFCLGWVSVGPASAQILTTLHSFTAFSANSSNNIDGAIPLGELVLVSSNLYGTASFGGTNGNGTIFAVSTNGTGFTNLHTFTQLSNLSANRDGARPLAGLVEEGPILYGTTAMGGTNATGAIFAINTDGTGFGDIYDFSLLAGVFNPLNHDGARPQAALAISGNNLYGTANIGGTATFGTAFFLNVDGTVFSTLHSFSELSKFFPFSNSDGNQPVANLAVSGNLLYGTAPDGGTNGTGVVFRMNTGGTDFVTLHSFASNFGFSNTNLEGAVPLAGLVVANGKLYGTASSGGTNGFGTIFSLNTDGSDFTNLYNFTNGVDGANPHAGLFLAGDVLFGTTFAGGTNSDGAVFSINVDGTGFTSIYNFTGGNDGANPDGGVILSGINLYGTTSAGGTNGTGTVYQLSLHPAFFTGEFTRSNGVFFLVFPATSNLFGFYNYDFFPTMYHYDLGFEYFIDAQDGVDGAYFYDFTTNHFWYTNPTTFPYLYDFTLNAWLYYFPDPHNRGHYSTNPRFFYNFSTGQYFTQ